MHIYDLNTVRAQQATQDKTASAKQPDRQHRQHNPAEALTANANVFAAELERLSASAAPAVPAMPTAPAVPSPLHGRENRQELNELIQLMQMNEKNPGSTPSASLVQQAGALVTSKK